MAAGDWVLKEGQHPQAIEVDGGQREIHMLLFLPKGHAQWNSAEVNGLLDELLRRLPVDPDRVYLTGTRK